MECQSHGGSWLIPPQLEHQKGVKEETTVMPTEYRRHCSRVSSDVSRTAELSQIFLNFVAISYVKLFVLVCIERTVR